MKVNQKGFSVVEVLLALLVVGLIGSAGWYVWHNKSNTRKQTATTANGTQSSQLEAYKRTTTIPKDWIVYSNDKYKFDISYPSNWRIDANDGNTLAESTKAKDKSFFSLGFRPYSAGSMEIQYVLDVSHETLEQAVNWRENIVRDGQAEGGGTGVKFTITNKKYFTYDGHQAVRIDQTSDDGTPPNSYSSEIYISANELLYKFDTSFHDKNALEDKDILTVFESLKIK